MPSAIFPLVNDLDLLVDDFAGKTVDRRAGARCGTSRLAKTFSVYATLSENIPEFFDADLCLPQNAL